MVLRFNAYAEVAGTYGVSIRSSNGDRCWLGSFTLEASKWKTVQLAVPGSTAGTWDTGNTFGLSIRIYQAAGSSMVGVPGWQAGNLFVPPGCINGAEQANKPLYVTDVGLYVDPDNTGFAPAFEAPDFTTTMMKCQRYWRPYDTSIAQYLGNDCQVSTPIEPFMRVAPVTGIIAAGSTSNATAVNIYPAISRVNIQLVPAAQGMGGVYNRSYSLNARM